MREIQLRDAKASLSAVVDDAVRSRTRIVTRHGKPEAVILSFEEWQRTLLACAVLRPVADGRATRGWRSAASQLAPLRGSGL